VVAFFDPVADLDLRSQVASFSDLAAVHDAVLDHEHVEAIAVEDDCSCRHDQ
jgi:hypothetical protein